MSKNKKIKRFIIRLLIFTFALSIFVGTGGTITKVAYAKSWTDNANQNIYGGSSLGNQDDIKESKPNIFEKYVSGLVRGLGVGLHYILKLMGITMDRIIYGRVGGNAPEGIAYYTFELKPGNPYGVIGALMYKVIAEIAIVFMVMTVFAKFSLANFMMGNSKSRDEFKSAISVGLLSMALVFLMPYFLDVALYLRDLILSIVSQKGTTTLFSNADKTSLTYYYYMQADKSKTLVDALMYLSTVLLTLYLALLYVGYAMTLLICFILFPVVCAGMNYDKKLFGNWIKLVFSTAIIPVMDCILFMIPLFIGALPNGNNLGVLKLIICAMVVPSRNVIRQVLGLSSGGLEFAGIATMMGAMNLARSAGGAIHRVSEGVREGHADGNMSKFYDALGKQDNVASGPQGVSAGDAGIGLSSGSTSSSASTVSSGVSSNGGPSVKGVSASGGVDPMKYVNRHNFENFQGLSNEQKAKFYKQRAVEHFARNSMRAAGSIAGGLAGAGSSLFMGPGVMTNMASLGIQAGGAVGSEMGGLIGTAYSDEGTYKHKTKKESNITQTNSSKGTSLQKFGNDYYEAMPADEDEVNFARMNLNNATATAGTITSDYIANDGSKLHDIYSSVHNDKKHFKWTNAQKKDEFKRRAGQNMQNDFMSKMASDGSIRLTRNEEVNKKGLKELNDRYSIFLNDKERGVLSERFLNNYDWYK